MDSSGVFLGRKNRLLTERLELAPLTREEMELYAASGSEFAEKLGLSESPCELSIDFLSAVNWCIDHSLSHSSEDLPFCVLWAIIERSSRRFVGSINFKGAPVDGEAEIGYGIDAPYRGRGFMSESVGAFVGWGRGRADLRVIVAETLNDNFASQRVLEKNGFVVFDRQSPEGDSFFWRFSYEDERSI